MTKIIFLFVALVLYYNKVLAAIQVPAYPILPYGIEPYSGADGKCFFDFVIDKLDFKGVQITYCTISSLVLVCDFEVIKESTTVKIKSQTTSTVGYPDLNVNLSFSNGSTVTLSPITFNKTLLSYTCSPLPTFSTRPLFSLSKPRLLNTSYSISNYQFQAYFNILLQSPAFSRPLDSSHFVFPVGVQGYEMTVKYITNTLYLLTFKHTGQSFTTKFSFLFLGYQVDVIHPIASDKYPNVAIDNSKSISTSITLFKSTGNIVKYISLDSTTSSVVPVFYEDYIPMYGDSFASMNMFYKNKDVYYPTYITNNQWTPLSNFVYPASSDIGPVVSVYPDTPFSSVRVETQWLNNNRFSFYMDDLMVPQHIYYPFGLVKVENKKRVYAFPVAKRPYQRYYKINVGVLKQYEALITTASGTAVDSLPPTVSSYSVTPINETTSVLGILFSDNLSGFYYALVQTGAHRYYIRAKDLVNTNSTNSETMYNIYVHFKKSASFNVTVSDNEGNSKEYSNEYLHYHVGVPLPVSEPLLPSLLSSFIFNVTSVSVASSPANVILSVGLDGNTNQLNTLMLRVFTSPLQETKEIIGTFNIVKQVYQFPFTIPQKLMSGYLNYTLYINEQPIGCDVLMIKFGKLAEVYIDNPGDFRMMPPVVSSYLQSPNTTDVYPLLYFELTFDAPFTKAIVQIAGDYDVLGRNYTFRSSQVVRISFQVEDGRCRPQAYYFQYLYVEDMYGNKGEYIRDSTTSVNSFYTVQENFQTFVQYITCRGSVIDLNAPEITSLSIKQVADQFKQLVLVSFTTYDAAPGISLTNVPLCVFHAKGNEYLSVNANKIGINPNGSINYDCLFDIPIGYGPDLFLSIYGIADLQFNYIGYDTAALRANYLPYSFTLTPVLAPIITSTSSLETSSELLIINGYNFMRNGASVGLNIIIKTDAGDFPQLLSFDTTSGIALVRKNLPPAYEYVVQVVDSISNLSSNIVVLKGPLTKGSTSSSSSSSSVPITCSSDCGVSQGYGKCINGACVCNPSQSGIDCKSKVDDTTVITPNPSQPTVNVTIPGTSSTETPKFTSFIYVVALRELDNSNTVINNYVFNSNKWILVNEGSSSNDQVTTIQYKYIIDEINTNITSTVQVFSQSTNITFGNQQLFMNPSTIKFTFNITSYPFSKSTNALQLVMTAALESTDSIACSYKEFIDDQSNSQYLKLQIEDRSLFGRFIKFGMIDGRERVVTNTQLDNSYGGKELSKSTSDQSYIGLNIPYYTKYALLDPDFSVLIDQNKAGDQENSICTSSSKKLSNAQIAGIVIGGAVFLFIVGAALFYIYTRKSTSTLAVKLRRIGK